MKKILPFTILLILFSAVGAQAPKESWAGKLILSTYYPAPFGSYDRMKLVPRAALADTYCENRPSNASMYYTENRASGPDSVRYCLKDESGNQDWVPYPGVWTQNRDDVVSLTDNGLTTNPLKVGIRTTSPDEALHVSGNIKMVDGNEGVDKVLTSDANGVGTWQPAGGGVPSGGIIMWSGSYNDIPTGWALCDGSNGTPDLRDKFIQNVDASYVSGNDGDVGTAGGADTHAHNYSDLPSHSHSVSDPGHAHNITHGGGGGGSSPSGSTSYKGTYMHVSKSSTTGLTLQAAGVGSPSTDSGSSLPPYYKLAFIMKL